MTRLKSGVNSPVSPTSGLNPLHMRKTNEWATAWSFQLMPTSCRLE